METFEIKVIKITINGFWDVRIKEVCMVYESFGDIGFLTAKPNLLGNLKRDKIIAHYEIICQMCSLQRLN